MAEERDYAVKQLLSPFTDPEPSQETGPGTHFRSSFTPMTPEASPPSYKTAPSTVVAQSTGGSSTNPYRRKQTASVHTTSVSSHGQLTPPPSTSPQRAEFAKMLHDDDATLVSSGVHRTQSTSAHRSGPVVDQRRNRSVSLNERYPGDRSMEPLATIRKENRRAHRPSRSGKRAIQGADTIDRLDGSGLGHYHHEGPYDAASWARNVNPKTSPLLAVERSNREALRATPRENVLDSLRRHRPLDGVAAVPSGHSDMFGRRYNYKEGSNLMIEGDYRRWPGMEYKDEDIKGKGEPSYSIEKALKDHKNQQRQRGDSTDGIEMQTHRRIRSTFDAQRPLENPFESTDMQRSNSEGRGFGTGLKKRLGSLRRRNREVRA